MIENKINYLDKNKLDINQNLISEDLQELLINGQCDKDYNEDKFYLVVFRVLKKGEKILFYNYISYPLTFCSTFLVYMLNKNINSLRHKE